MPRKQPDILLLAASEASTLLERRALREAGFGEIRFLSSGMEAARLLNMGGDGYFSPDLVICEQKLSDIDGERFCAIIREHAGLKNFPILLVAPNESEAAQLRHFGCLASGIIGRPYSVDTFLKALEPLCASQWRKEWEKAGDGGKAFENALATQGVLLAAERQPEDYLRAGMRRLHERKWVEALGAFKKALADPALAAEAEMGLAAASKGKGDIAAFLSHLAAASEILARDWRWKKARTAYARLLQHDKGAKNPILGEAHRLARLQDYNHAAEALAQCLGIIPKNRIGQSFAKICFAAENPDAMLSALAKALENEDPGEVGNALAETRLRLAELAREREEKRRQMAAERKWQLARAMAESKKAEAREQAPEKPQPHDKTESGERPAEKSQRPARIEPFDSSEELETDAGEGPDDGMQALQPLAPLDFSGGNSASPKEGGSDLFSVVKLTWNLARRSEKK